jgi:hypothetical protein
LECILLTFYVLSLIWMLLKANVLTLITHFGSLESVRLKRNGIIVTRRDDDDGPDKYLTISELSK